MPSLAGHSIPIRLFCPSCRASVHWIFRLEVPEHLQLCCHRWRRHHCTSWELACSKSVLACSRSELACSRSEPACSRSELVCSTWELACGTWAPEYGTSWGPACSSRCGCQTTIQHQPSSFLPARMCQRPTFQTDSASSLSSSGHH